MPRGCRVVLITAPEEAAERLSQSLVEERLAACVNVIPGIVSHYWWEGKIQRDSEKLLIAKTRAALVARLCSFVKKNHPYSNPEVIALPIREGSREYLKWLAASTTKQGAAKE